MSARSASNAVAGLFNFAAAPQSQGCFPRFQSRRRGTGSTAAARLQFTFDLLSGQLIDSALHAFTRVDQAAAKDVLPLLAPGDLLIRDLGYFALDAFAAIEGKRSFYLSRYRHGTLLD